MTDKIGYTAKEIRSAWAEAVCSGNIVLDQRVMLSQMLDMLERLESIERAANSSMYAA